MVVYKRTLKNVRAINGQITENVYLEAWNDSGCDWVVTCNGHTEIFLQRKWTMKTAIKLTAELWGDK